MENARVLFVGNVRMANNEFVQTLQKRYVLTVVSSGKQSLGVEPTPRVVILDAASLRTPGDRLCQQLRTRFPKALLVHIHPAPKDESHSTADLLLAAPIVAKRALHSIESLLKGNHEECLVCGPFMLNVLRRTMVVRGVETQLTPRCALLMEIFLRQPGQTHDRRALMEKVWKTDYLGDTRTLDVHIRWLRQVLELDAGKPRYLRTVRGVGYRLEVDEHPGDEVEMVQELEQA